MIGKFIRPMWRKGKPKHHESGFSEPVIVILDNGLIKSDRYGFGFRGDRWEKYGNEVAGWFYLPKGNYTIEKSVGRKLAEWALSR